MTKGRGQVSSLVSRANRDAVGPGTVEGPERRHPGDSMGFVTCYVLAEEEAFMSVLCRDSR